MMATRALAKYHHRGWGCFSLSGEGPASWHCARTPLPLCLKIRPGLPGRSCQKAIRISPCDTLGTIFHDAVFAILFPACGQLSLPLWRLALVTIMQFRENL